MTHCVNIYTPAKACFFFTFTVIFYVDSTIFFVQKKPLLPVSLLWIHKISTQKSRQIWKALRFEPGLFTHSLSSGLRAGDCGGELRLRGRRGQ